MASNHELPCGVSCEFFPPNSEAGADKLNRVHGVLRQALKPRYCSVTYGAGGSTRERTTQAVLALKETGESVAPHLTCVASTHESVRAILHEYREHGIDRIVALRGDRPSGAGMAVPGELRYASELVQVIREETGAHFHIEVAAYPEYHPQARDPDSDLRSFKSKIDAGADGAITQYFFNADAYFRFVEECSRLGVDAPIVPGIMPITNYKQLARFSDQCGTEIPRWLRLRLAAFGEDTESLMAFGTDVVSELCQRLLDNGIPGLHFYTMNRAEPTLAVCRNLGLVS